MIAKEKIEYIRAKCIEANPEIVELKFGCEVEFSLFGIPVRATFAGLSASKHDKSNREDKKMAYWLSSTGVIANDDVQHLIIGRPIRLADVLLAVEDRLSVVGSKHMGCFLQYNGPTARWVNRENALWNLRKDSLEEQSEETIDFIYNLLT